ncbi:MAG: extracellular solute-binding protein family 5 [Thermoleophilia bacterium]|nr:extracellular solute-binding protein family 5 [Thermoleophilia bacterium]
MGQGRITRLLGLALLLIAAATLAAGCGAAADSAGAADGPAQHGGTLTVAMEQAPNCLNAWIVCGGMAATSTITSPLFDSLLITEADGTKVPQLATQVPTTENGSVVETKSGGMDVTVHLVREGRWSDGKPITCDDLKFTQDLMMDDRWMVSSRTGYELVKNVECPDPLTAIYHFKERYAPFLSIVGGTPLPKHVLQGKDFNTYFNNEITVSSGPFLFDHWDHSVEVVLKRNPHYWNAGKDEKPWIDRLRYTFVPDTNTLKIQLRTGEVDVAAVQPDTSVREELESFPRGGYQIKPSVFWEQLAFNTSKAPTNDVNVRRAIAFSIDRTQITDTVLRKQVGELNSTVLPAQKDYYTPAWSDVKPDSKRAQAYLEKAGYKREGAYYAKNGKPLTIVFKSTAGNNLRLKVAQLLQQELRQNGIKMEINMEPPTVFFGTSTIQGAYDIALWAWSSNTDPSQRTLFSCDQIPSEANDFQGNNNYRYCNEDVTKWLKAADVEPDVAKRAELTKRVQVQMRKDMPLLPIYQRPDTVAYTDRAKGLANNPFGGLTWNTADWSVTAQ